MHNAIASETIHLSLQPGTIVADMHERNISQASCTTEAEMNTAIQSLLVPVLALQPGLGTPAEYTIYSGRIGGLTAAKLLGSTPELINMWGGWVQGGTGNLLTCHSLRSFL